MDTPARGRNWKWIRAAEVLPPVRFLNRLLDRTSTGGVLLGLVFFALSLTPSLLPRNFVIQGILTGCVFAAGYGIGVFLEWLWNFMELSVPGRRLPRGVRLAAFLVAVTIVFVFLWQSTSWQNSIRAAMDMQPVETNNPLWVTLIALLPAIALIGIGTVLVHGMRFVARRLTGIIPRRVALVIGIVSVGLATTLFVNGVVLRWSLYAADQFYARLDALAGQYEEAPTDPLRSGSDASFVAWETIGLDARSYVQSGPTADEISEITGKPAVTPLRVYVGLRSAETVEQRARLALAEMQRVGAFERSVLVLIMPVGTGWVDPAAIDTLEIVHNGDVASVALQYSYLTSWISLLAEPEVGTAAAQALFTEIYQYWTALPEGSRPRLYLHGLSLGAYASQASATLYDVLADPFDGALWAGPPFASEAWQSATANRLPGSPEWLPLVGNSSVVRFTNQENSLDVPGASWGPIRLVYLQYPSDPIVFFDPAVLYRPPEWLSGDRPQDISPQLNWYPVVTFLQLLADLVLAQTSPIGFGHVYAPQDYLEAWIAVTDPQGWSDAELDRLGAKLTRQGQYADIGPGWFRAAQEP
ncbi:membrane protein [Devosia pacifica]|uniref:Membrane protein n=1 Tax=Devosia pacifica TaxID=1335967 RepID=A0A918SFQ9_9HYPH|nr:alpha/beta-hydrolase family protein [Devosia pacifica]GHA36813.1 membrane protein [Devosia pacifica]